MKNLFTLIHKGTLRFDFNPLSKTSDHAINQTNIDEF
jgi:hypothetical protein